jgi:carbon-monoxide dehydrogenase medium subunit
MLVNHSGMHTPDYMAPATLEDAVLAKRDHGEAARVIAGGTDLVLRMRDGALRPETLIDLRRLSLDQIEQDDHGFCLGALTPLSAILENDAMLRHFPALPEACGQFAGPPIRNLATLGGNIVNASPAADTVPPLISYDAEVVLEACSGKRVLPLQEFLTGPGTNVMAPDELLTAIRLPMPVGRTASAFAKLGQRRSMAISVVNLAVRITLDETGKVAAARIVLGSVAPVAFRARGAESLLEGSPLSNESVHAAAAEARREARPISDVRGSETYRDRMVEVLVRRTLATVREGLAA